MALHRLTSRLNWALILLVESESIVQTHVVLRLEKMPSAWSLDCSHRYLILLEGQLWKCKLAARPNPVALPLQALLPVIGQSSQGACCSVHAQARSCYKVGETRQCWLTGAVVRMRPDGKGSTTFKPRRCQMGMNRCSRRVFILCSVSKQTGTCLRKTD